jgi:hypothetical protein
MGVKNWQKMRTQPSSFVVAHRLEAYSALSLNRIAFYLESFSQNMSFDNCLTMLR